MCDAIAKSLLRFDVSRKYFGEVSSKDLNESWSAIEQSANVYSKDIKVGRVTSQMIFDAIWKQMSLNPVRWGTENPFGDKGIIHFCQKIDLPSSEFLKIRDKLYIFLNLNALPNGQWSDNLQTNNGLLEIAKNTEGHTNNNYQKVRVLLNCIKDVTGQNVEDFIVKRGPHRNPIINCLIERFPEQVKPKDFGMVLDVPSNTLLDMWKKYNYIPEKEWLARFSGKSL